MVLGCCSLAPWLVGVPGPFRGVLLSGSGFDLPLFRYGCSRSLNYEPLEQDPRCEELPDWSKPETSLAYHLDSLHVVCHKWPIPTQGSPAATIASGRTDLQDEPLHCSVAARLPALVSSAGLCPDTLGRDPPTGSLPPTNPYLQTPGLEVGSLAGLPNRLPFDTFG